MAPVAATGMNLSEGLGCCSSYGKAAPVRALRRPNTRCDCGEGCHQAPQSQRSGPTHSMDVAILSRRRGHVLASNRPASRSHYAQRYGVLARACTEAAPKYLTRNASLNERVPWLPKRKLKKRSLNVSLATDLSLRTVYHWSKEHAGKHAARQRGRRGRCVVQPIRLLGVPKRRRAV